MPPGGFLVLPAFALFVALLGSGMAGLRDGGCHRPCDVGVAWVCSQGRGPASLEAGPAAVIRLPVLFGSPPTSAVGRCLAALPHVLGTGGWRPWGCFELCLASYPFPLACFGFVRLNGIKISWGKSVL